MRPIHEIATEIQAVWRKLGKGIYFGAVPYLEAMRCISDKSDHYGCDSGESVILYGLSNMATFRGADARRLKAELKAHLS